MFLSGLPGPAAELGLGTVVAAARLKVLAALPPELRARASRVAERFHLDAPGWFQASESLPHLEILAGAVWDNRTILMRYRRGERGGVVERHVDPLGLVLKGGVWYLVGRTDGEFRTYRVSRVEDVQLIEDRFERPDDFDLADHWERSTEAYERSIERFPITVRLAPERLDAFAGIAGSRIMAAATRTPDPDYPELVRLRVAFDWMDEAVGAVLRMGADAEVARTGVAASIDPRRGPGDHRPLQQRLRRRLARVSPAAELRRRRPQVLEPAPAVAFVVARSLGGPDPLGLGDLPLAVPDDGLQQFFGEHTCPFPRVLPARHRYVETYRRKWPELVMN